MKWISVNERLPKRDKSVLIAILHRYENAEWDWDICIATLESDGENWLSEDCNSYTDPEYWMPLPSPPKLTEEQERKSRSGADAAYEKELARAERELERIKKAKRQR